VNQRSFGKTNWRSFWVDDPEPDVPEDVTPMAQCAFEVSMFKISAVHISYRSWLRSSSTYEPSDPPIRLDTFTHEKMVENGVSCWRRHTGAH
jgi:hypothetical protein